MARVLTCSVLTLAMVVILATDVFVLTERNVTTAFSLDQTLKRFRVGPRRPA